MFEISEENMQIVEKTTSCNDCENIPKVKNAGKIISNYQLMHNGVKIVRGCYHGDWMTKIIQDLKGHHEPQEEKAFYEVLEKISSVSPTMIELGSFWSYYSLWFRNKFSNARNIMIEPHEYKKIIGEKNFELNKFEGIFEHAFIDSTSEEKSNFITDNGDISVINKISVDDIIQKYNLEQVDILHSDIQGSEYNMLLGAKKSIINKKINFFFVSTHGSYIHENCLNYLQNNDYKILCSHSTEESFSNDGLIVASANQLEDKITISKR